MPHQIKRLFSTLFPYLLVGAVFSTGTMVSQCAPPQEQFPKDPDSLFLQVVLPMLERECGECHLPGGDVYSSFPFDESSIVLDRIDEILMGLEGKSRKPLEYWKELMDPGNS